MPPITGEKKKAAPKQPKQATAKKETAQNAVNNSARPVVHEKVDVKIFQGDKALTVKQAKELLGWQYPAEGEDFKDKFLFIDGTGKKVRCLNNTHNRPFSEGWARTLGQDVLNRHWRFNLETIIIGKTGLNLSGQHRLIGLVLAAQMWEGWWYNPASKKFEQSDEIRKHWLSKWETEPTIETLVAFGGDESDDYTKTLDNVKPRSLSDVLFCSTLFGKYGENDRKIVTKMADSAVRLLWHRTGAGLDAFTPKRTHAESLDFIDRHPKLLKAIKHIFEENSGNAIGKYVNPGVAAALLYLMAASKTEQISYDAKRVEKSCDMSSWDKACEFWVLFGNGNASFKEVKYALGALANEETGDGGSLSEKMGVICKAWNEFSSGGALSEKTLALEYGLDDDGIKRMIGCPTVGGVDLGDPEKEEKEDAVSTTAKDDPTPEEIDQGTREAIEERSKNLDEKKKKLLENRKKKATPVTAETATTPKTAPATTKDKEPSLADSLNEIKAKHKGKVVLFKSLVNHNAWGDDAVTVAKVLGLKVKHHVPAGNMERTDFPSKELAANAKKLIDAGLKVAICVDEDGKPKVTDYVPETPAV